MDNLAASSIQAISSRSSSLIGTELGESWQGNDIEPSIVNTGASTVNKLSHEHWHGHGPLIKAKALSCPSLAFGPNYTEKFNQHRRLKKSKAFAVMSVALPAVVAALTALAAFAVGELTKTLGEYRVRRVQDEIRNGSWILAWLIHFGLMLSFALVGSLPVIYFAKSGGSSGIPAIIALLNGCDVRGDMSVLFVAVKLCGVIMSVSSGLAVGPEGPMIFIGAGIGLLVSRLPSNRCVWKFFGRPPITMNEHTYVRDYTAIGAGCGIAAAFRAPIAGTMFVIEEAASHFRKENLAKFFFAGIVALFVMLTLNRGEGLLEYKVATGPHCQTWNVYSMAILWFVLIGVVCGLCGALFNTLNIKLSVFRALHANALMHLRRIMEMVFICLLTSAAWTILPFLIGENIGSASEILHCSNGCMNPDLAFQVTAGTKNIPLLDLDSDNPEAKLVPKPCLYGVQQAVPLCHQAFDLAADSSRIGSDYAKTCTVDLQRNTSLEHLDHYDDYCCAFESMGALERGEFMLPSNATCHLHFSQLHYPTFANFSHASFNPMASLTLVPFANVALNLFQRGAPFMLPIGTLLLFLIFFFLLAVATAGSAIPSGLLLPQIIIGATIGRSLTLVILIVQLRLGWYSPASSKNSIWVPEYSNFFSYSNGPLKEDTVLTTISFIEPGIGAIVGAAAFLGGSGRISLFVAVMLVEITGDPMIILPVGIATLIAVTIGNVFNHGLYHMLIDVQSFPYLPDRWPKHIPACFSLRDALPKLFDKDRPVEVAKIFAGATKDDVRALLEQHSFKAYPVVNIKEVAVGIVKRCDLQELVDELHSSSDDDSNEDRYPVMGITDPYPVMVRADMHIEAVYELYKRMEMRRLIVVDDAHRPVAVLTRRTLLPWFVQDASNELDRSCIGDLPPRSVSMDASLRRPDSWLNDSFLNGPA